MADGKDTEAVRSATRARRIVMFPPFRIAIGGAFVVGSMVAAQALREQLVGIVGGPILPSLLTTLLTVPAVIAAYVLFVRIVERRAVLELSLRRLGIELGAGWLVGGALFATVVGVLAAAGIYRVEGTGDWTVLVEAFLFSFGPAAFEELAFRGVLFRVIEEVLGSWIALAFTAAVFGLLHLVNEDATLQGALAIVLEAGVLLGAAYMLTRRLWLVIGIHAAWNYVQGGVFGISVSGTGADGFLSSRLEGPEILTGGVFGAEGSIVAVGIGLAAAVAFLILARRRGHVVRPFWSRRRARGESIS
jgi:membrane protease YdiL (CAAX protease family)